MKPFMIRMEGADDYGRVFVNNHLVLNQEDPRSIFYTVAQDQDANKKILPLVVNRAANMLGTRDIKPFLKIVVNYIVIELENSIMGSCVMQIDIKVNDVGLPSFPRTLPNDFDVEPEFSNNTLLSEYRRLGAPALEDAICARRIFEVNLD